MYNKLLERLIRRNLKGEEISESFAPIFKAISESFDHYESSRALLERSLDVSSQELNDANAKIREAYQEIDAKNKDILDSIKYAKKIQDAILPTERMLQERIEGSFILFKPKDIVSGDFYWMEQTDSGDLILAAVDCTGHGVPGAFMSMIGNAFLNEIVKEKNITSPKEILGTLRSSVILSLKQKGEIGEAQDGMDIALCNLNLDNMMLSYAGANNPLYYFKSNGLTIQTADKQPIAFHLGDHKPYTEHSLKISKGDTFYIFTDGYADQFGGPHEKKFMYRQFRDLLIEIQDKDMHEQKAILEQRIEEWKGDLEQIDDVCVMGFRI